jgi:hypothetical protein
VLLQEQPRLGIDERGGVAVGDRHALRGAGRSRGEDDPRIVVRFRTRPRGCRGGRRIGQRRRRTQHELDAGLAEDQPRAFVGIVGVHRDVGCAGGQHTQDRHVQLARTGGQPDAHAIAAADVRLGETIGQLVGRGRQLAIRHCGATVVDGECVGVRVHARGEHVEQRSRRRGGAAVTEHAWPHRERSGIGRLIDHARFPSSRAHRLGVRRRRHPRSQPLLSRKRHIG